MTKHPFFFPAKGFTDFDGLCLLSLLPSHKSTVTVVRGNLNRNGSNLKHHSFDLVSRCEMARIRKIDETASFVS